MSRAAGTTPPTRSRAREATQAKRKERFLKELNTDYLDIVFRLEKTFDIKIDRDELMFGNSTSAEYFKDDRITDAGLEEIRRRFPGAAIDAVEKSRGIADFVRVFTVATLVAFVKEKLATREAD